MKKRTILSITALASLFLGPACGSESTAPAPASEPVAQAPAEPTEPAAAPEVPAHPSMNECIATCEAEHGPIVNHGVLAECVRQEQDTDACAHRAINEATNRCQRICRGLPPELPEHLRQGAGEAAEEGAEGEAG